MNCPKCDAEGNALAEAVEVFANHGIDFRLPWDCDLDDLERERFDALLAACRAYHRRMTTLTQPQTGPAAK